MRNKRWLVSAALIISWWCLDVYKLPGTILDNQQVTFVGIMERYMTKSQKREAAKLRDGGASYAQITQALGLSVNTIKSFCRRNVTAAAVLEVPGLPEPVTFCHQCGRRLGKSTQKTRRFCSDACRMAWWKAHPDNRDRRAIYHFTCPRCGAAFDSYGKAGRKYCSRLCYYDARRKPA